MPSIRKFLFFLYLLLPSYFLLGQNSNEIIPLVDAFILIEKEFKCNFSFQDQDLTDHVISISMGANLEETILFLERNTLFNFTLLANKNIAVSLKPNLIHICGSLINGATAIPFENVTVTTPYQKITTDVDGNFSAPLLNPLQTVSLASTGYKTIQITTKDYLGEPCKNIVLNPEVQQLKQLVLINYLAKGIYKNQDGSVTVNYNDFNILPGLIEPDVLQTIQALPGIQSVNETVSFINIRGGTHDQNLILWDGIKMYQSGHFFGLISAFNPFLTKEVIIFKNGSSAIYGDGVSGVISMMGDSKINENLNAGWGINLISTDAYLDIPVGKKASLQISGRKSINSVFETPTYKAYFDKAFQNTEVITNNENQNSSDDDFNFYDTHFRLLYQPSSKDYIRINFLALGNQLDFLENAVVNGLSISRKSELAQNNISAGIFYKRIWNEKLISDIQLYGSTYQLQATNFDILNDQRLMQENEVIETGIKLSSFYHFTNKASVQVGYQFNETGITNFEQINNPFFEKTDKQVLRTHSIFTELEHSIFQERTLVKFGLRLNHISKFNKLLLEPRISINHRFWNFFTFEILGELKSQTTAQIIDFQNDFLGVENRRWVLSNPENIPILRGQQLSIGLSYNRYGMLISVEPYIKRIYGITTQSQGFQNQFEDIKTSGDYYVNGVDVLLSKRVKNINTWLSYSYAVNDYSFTSLTPEKFPNNIDITHSLTYGINYSWNGFNISGGFNWRSGKPTTTVNLFNPIENDKINYNSPNDSNLSDYIRVDVSGTYQFKLGNHTKAFIGFSVWNLLDTKNTLNTFHRINDEDIIDQINEISLQFTPNASFRLLF